MPDHIHPITGQPMKNEHWEQFQAFLIRANEREAARKAKKAGNVPDRDYKISDGRYFNAYGQEITEAQFKVLQRSNRGQGYDR